MKRLIRWLFVAVLSLPLAAQSVVLNAPRDVEEYAEKTLFTAFGGRSPRTLDPQRSYSSDETAYTYGIYEPLYQYHYLKRPYTLVPRTAVRVVEPRYFDAKGRELPVDAPAEAIAVSVYDIPIQKGIRFAPHPASRRTGTETSSTTTFPTKRQRQRGSPATSPSAARANSPRTTTCTASAASQVPAS